MPGLARMLGNLLIRAQLRWVWLTAGRKLLATTRDPMRVQRSLLASFIRNNRATTFGKQHHFEKIGNYVEFCQHVPVFEYEMLRDYVRAAIERDEPSLTKQAPVAYVRTSGTSGLAKDIPLTRDHLIALKRIHRLAVANQHRLCPEAFTGSILAITSPAVEGDLGNGKHYGSASGVVSVSTSALVREKFVVPDAVLTVSNSRIKYLLILRLAMCRADLTHIACANPTTLLTLVRLYHEHTAELLSCIEKGGFFLADQVPPAVWASIANHFIPQPQRAAEIAERHRQTGCLRLVDLWPQLRLVVTWTCASAGVAARLLHHELPQPVRILELGYLSSEFRGTITLGLRSGSGLPTFDTHFFEFVERDQWDDGKPQFLTLDALRKHRDYYVIVTTPSGLYRYFINDLVRVTGFFNRTPLFKFLQKGKGVTNITGEKLYESQVLAAVHASLDGLCAARFIMALADEEKCCYRFYIEAHHGAKPAAGGLAKLIDNKLGELNLEYSGKRESARLAASSVIWLRSGAEEAYKKFCVENGQREGQFKTVALAYAQKFKFDLDAFSEQD